MVQVQVRSHQFPLPRSASKGGSTVTHPGGLHTSRSLPSSTPSTVLLLPSPSGMDSIGRMGVCSPHSGTLALPPGAVFCARSVPARAPRPAPAARGWGGADPAVEGGGGGGGGEGKLEWTQRYTAPNRNRPCETHQHVKQICSKSDFLAPRKERQQRQIHPDGFCLRDVAVR